LPFSWKKETSSGLKLEFFIFIPNKLKRKKKAMSVSAEIRTRPIRFAFLVDPNNSEQVERRFG